jgi:small GTP-binding protein
MLKSKIEVLLYGIEKSGKSTIINSFQKRRFEPGIPFTAHQTYDVLTHSNIPFSIIEVGGRKEVRRFVTEYIEHVDAYVYVIDGSNEGSFREVKSEFNQIINHPYTVGRPLAILFHKTDIATVHPSVIIDQLDILNRYDRPHRVFSTTAKKPLLFDDVLTWIDECLKEEKTILQDRDSRFLSIFIFDILEEKKQGLPLIAILGQVEIMCRTGQVEYNRDKILVLMRRLRSEGDLEFDERDQIWHLTDQGRKKISSPELVKGTKHEKLRAIIDDQETESSTKDVADEFDLDELADLYKKSTE